jgi:hypothetical protein
MSYTIDCGEGRHSPTCSGYGDDAYLIPQLKGEFFSCTCLCHTKPENQKPEKSPVTSDNSWLWDEDADDY